MKIILASKSGVRKKILDNHNIECDVIVSNVDEDEIVSTSSVVTLVVATASSLIFKPPPRVAPMVTVFAPDPMFWKSTDLV